MGIFSKPIYNLKSTPKPTFFFCHYYLPLKIPNLLYVFELFTKLPLLIILKMEKNLLHHKHFFLIYNNVIIINFQPPRTTIFELLKDQEFSL